MSQISPQDVINISKNRKKLGEQAAGEKVKGAPLQTSPPKELTTEEEKTCSECHSALFQLERKKQDTKDLQQDTAKMKTKEQISKKKINTVYKCQNWRD